MINRETTREDAPQFGHFLTHGHWLQGLSLLKFQLEIKKENRHFRTLEICYYKKLEQSFEKLEDEKYFNTRIANNLFYGLRKEFAVFPYPIPKSNLGLRRYNFMTCPMRVLYYAIGVYLLELSTEYLDDNYKVHKHIWSAYGGNLYFKDSQNPANRDLSLKSDNVYYKSHYMRFQKELRREINDNTERRVVIYLDILNYFEELSIPKLLNLLEVRVKESTKIKKNFDKETQAQLVSFFDFVSSGTSGIPQSDNNIVSGFIGHLFLAFGDLFIDDELWKGNGHDGHVASHRIIRYMDDTYISITFKEQTDGLKDEFLSTLAPRISDCLYENLGRRLNPKTRLFDLRKKGDRVDLENNLKKVSQRRDTESDESNVPPKKRIKYIFTELKNLKNSSIDPYFRGNRELNEEVLKAVYDKDVQQMLEKPSVKSQLKDIFLKSEDFDFELVNAYPTPIIILILACNDVPEKFEEFLRSKTDFTSRDIWLVLSYLSQKEFPESELLDLLKSTPQLETIMKVFSEDRLVPELPGYFDLTVKQILRISKPNVVEQIRLRILAEQKGEYSVALSHLLNEIQTICHYLDDKAPALEEYFEPNVRRFLKHKNVPHDTKAQIQRLFDRRNKTPVPHADPIAWAVTRDEYEGYRCHVGKCLKHLLS